jgi:hypothetical protein
MVANAVISPGLALMIGNALRPRKASLSSMTYPSNNAHGEPHRAICDHILDVDQGGSLSGC